MILDDARRNLNRPVRIHPRRKGHGRHYGRALLVAIDGDWLWVKPFGRHRKLERMEARDVVEWKGKALNAKGES